MAEFLKTICEELIKIRVYLIKIGPSRRQGNICEKKLSEAKTLYQQYTKFLEEISRILQTKKEYEVKLINQFSENIEKLYSEIADLCKIKPIDCVTMAKFDLKIALNLLPVINDTELTTMQLIDGIEYYDSVLEDASKSNLIEFVLKSRLSQSAKLKLSKKYNKVSELLRDMKLHLLPKKSFIALSSKLQSAKQSEKSISDYGQEISNLFVDLTISQSEGHEDSYDVLKRVNEKLAIKRFADGLRNRRLSTIIAARNYSCLNDAIQAAVDEDISSTVNQNDILTMRKPNRYFVSNYRGNQRGMRSTSRPRNTHRGGRYQQRGSTRGWTDTSYRGRSTARGSRGRSYQNYSRGRQQQRGGQIHVIPGTRSPKFYRKTSERKTTSSFFEAKNNFIYSYNNSLFTTLSIDGAAYSWLIDTGASISAIKQEYIIKHNIPIHKWTTTINGIGGKVRAIGYACIKLTTQTYCFSHKFYVFDSLPCKADGIIGYDFLNKFGSCIDLQSKEMTLYTSFNNKIVLKLNNQLKHMYNIPSRSEINPLFRYKYE